MRITYPALAVICLLPLIVFLFTESIQHKITFIEFGLCLSLLKIQNFVYEVALRVNQAFGFEFCQVFYSLLNINFILMLEIFKFFIF